MVHCYMCDKDVEKYKTNSHVIPKCLIRLVKENGNFALIDNVNKVNRPEQNELIGEFICAECEERTAHFDDKFADSFFIRKNYLISVDTKVTINGITIDISNIKKFKSVEIYKNESFISFKLFIISLILRYYCYLKVYENKEFIPNCHLNELRKIYRQKEENLLNLKYPVIIWKYHQHLNLSIIYPQSTRLAGMNVLDIFILGYRISIFVDKRHIIPGNYVTFEIKNNDFKCFVINGLTKMHEDLWNNITTNKTLGKLKNILDEQSGKRKK